MSTINKPSQPLIPAEIDPAVLEGKADLVNGEVPSDQLPSYVDDVLEFADIDSFPAEGEEGKIYVALDTNNTYRWSGSAYVQVGGSGTSRCCVILTENTTDFALYSVEGVSGQAVAIEDVGLEQTKQELCKDTEGAIQAIEVVILGQTVNERYIIPGLLQMSPKERPDAESFNDIIAYLFTIDTAFGRVTISITTADEAVTVDWSKFKGVSVTGSSSSDATFVRDTDLQRALVDVCRGNAGTNTYTLNTVDDDKHYDFCRNCFNSGFGIMKAVEDIWTAFRSNELTGIDLFTKKMLVPVGLICAELSGFHPISSVSYDGGSNYGMLCCSIRFNCGSYDLLNGSGDDCVSGKLDAKLVFKFWQGGVSESVTTPRVTLVVGKGDVCELRYLYQPAISIGD